MLSWRPVLALLSTTCIAIVICGCDSDRIHSYGQQNAGSKPTDPIYVFAPSYTMTDVTNAVLAKLERAANASTNKESARVLHMLAPYDAKLINTIDDRWTKIVRGDSYFLTHTGQVVLTFGLYPDGSVSDLKVLRSTMEERVSLICQKVISDSSPFEPWSSEIKQVITNSIRTITFRFFFDESQ